MNQQTAARYIILCVVGVVMILSGILLAIFYTIPQGDMQTLSFVLGSIGFVVFFAGLTNAFTARNTKKTKILRNR
ncbi:MAG: hypothetical protein FWD84_02500 [Oscillospiraceae bacterium]|nr:hypothetical protein [Oscillospiraceae bacterium]